MTRAGVNHHSRGLVYDNKIIVDQQEFEREIFRPCHQFGPRDHFYFDGLACRDPV